MSAPNMRVIQGGKRDDNGARIPPHDLDAEAAVLASVLIDPAALPRIGGFLRAEHFYSEAHRHMFAAACTLLAAKKPIDIVTMLGELKDRGRLEQVGGAKYVTEILNAAPGVSNVVSYAIRVHEQWRARAIIAACEGIAARGYVREFTDTQAYADEAAKTVMRLASQNPVKPIESNRACLERILAETSGEHLPSSARPTEIGFPTGHRSLDGVLGGLIPGHKFTLAGGTGSGKTALAGAWAAHIAEHGGGVLFFSAEISRHKLLWRLMASTSMVSSKRMLAATKGQAPLAQWELNALHAAAAKIDPLPLVVDETSRLTIEDVRAIAIAQKERFPIEHRVPLVLIVLDYVQRLDASCGYERREKHERIEHATKEFKRLCQELGVAGLELAQAKEYQKTKSGRPIWPTKQTGIADSSQPAKEADELVFIVPTEKGPDVTRLVLYVAKGRDGGEGTQIPTDFERDLIRFTDPNDTMLPVRDHVEGAHAHCFSDMLGDGSS